MAKRRRNIKKKHNPEENEKTFLESVPEKTEEEWANSSEPIYAEDEEEEVLPQSEPIPEPEPIHVVESVEEVEPMTEETMEPVHNENEFSLGKYLREQRESQGISLKSVSQSTKISLTNLECLETDDLNALPNRAYVTGYVKSYSKLIGLDVNFCLKLLEKTYQSQGARPREPEIVIPQAQNSPQIASQLPVAKIGAFLAMVAVIGAIVVFFVNRKDNAPEIPIAETPKEEEIKEIQPQTLNAETPLQEEIVDNDIEDETSDNSEAEEVPEEPKQVALEKKPKVEEKKVEEKKEEEPKVVEEKKPKVEEKKAEEEKEERKFSPLTLPLYSVDKSLTSDQIDQLLPSSSRVTVQEGKQAVFIRANKGDSWLTYKKDDDPIKKFVLKEGRTLLFVAEEARVFLGNIGGVTIFLNNQPLKITSRTGVKSIVFPQENADKYMMPLFIYKDDGSVMTSKEWIDENQ